MNKRSAAELALVGVLAGGLYVAYEGIPDCVKTERVSDCVQGMKLPGDKGATQAKIGNLAVINEKPTGTASVLTFGEVTMQIGGPQSQSTFDYKAHNLADYVPGVNATKYWNVGGRATESVVYRPCIILGKDYRTTAEAPKPGDPSPNINQVDTNQQVAYNVVAAADGSVAAVNITAGALGACFPEIPNTKENQNLWTDAPTGAINILGPQKFGSTEFNTDRWIMNQLVLKFAVANACPGNNVVLSAVKTTVAKSIMADLVAKNPNGAKLYTDAFAAGKFNVDIAGPEAEQQAAAADLDQTKTEIGNMKKSFPDTSNHNATYSMQKPKLGKLTVTACTGQNSVGVQLSHQ